MTNGNCQLSAVMEQPSLSPQPLRHRRVSQPLRDPMGNALGKSGIHTNSFDVMCIKNGWGATDHIDLWNGAAMRGGFANYFGLGKEVWFWELVA